MRLCAADTPATAAEAPGQTKVVPSIALTAADEVTTIATVRLRNAAPIFTTPERTAFRPLRLLLAGALIAGATVGCAAPKAPELAEPAQPWPAGRDVVYAWLGQGDVASADMILDGTWPVPRFEPVTLAHPPTWTEDPYDESYWRFIFYGLRPLRHLLGAYRTTGDAVYLEGLADLLKSFADGRDASPHLADPHATAFRTMVQVAAYGALDRAGMLDTRTEEAVRASIAKDAAYLAEPSSFQGDYNHGFTEAAALLLVAETFGDDHGWGDLARERLDGLMIDTVDEDGVEVENSPFYHFYVMGFAADIAAWAHHNDVVIPDAFAGRLGDMVDYAAWILLPNGQVPLVGSSVIRTVNAASAEQLAALAAEHPHFEYVLSRGARGVAPVATSVLFPDSGTAVLRSGWGEDVPYAGETHVVFDVGPYRTDHSQLDGLSLNIHAGGSTVLPDVGLFTYEPGDDFDYFHGTRAHNTVMVDGRDQAEGAATAGVSTAGDGWSYQSGRHALYEGVAHERAVVLVGRDLVAVVDLLESDSSHVYTQLWHMAPDLTVRLDGGDAIGADADGRDTVRIKQAWESGHADLSFGDEGSHPGWYSERYERKEPGAVVAYEARGTRVRWATLLAFGDAARPGAASMTVDQDGDGVTLRICGPDAATVVTIHDLAGPDERVTAERGCDAGE